MTFECLSIHPSSLLLVKYFCCVASSRSLTSSSLRTDWVKVAYEGVAFRYSDIGFKLMDDPDTCQRTCTEDANCQFYTYVKKDFSNPVYRYSIFYACMQTRMNANIVHLTSNSGNTKKSCKICCRF